MRTITLLGLCLVLCWLAKPASAIAADLSDVSSESLWDVPSASLGHWVFDPANGQAGGQDIGGAFATASANAALRAALSSGIVRDETGSWLVAALLAGTTLAQHPHRAVVLDFEASPQSFDGGMKLQSFRAVLEVRAKGNHEALLSTLQSIILDRLVDGGTRGDLQQRAIELPGDRRGVAATLPAWADWRELSWHSSEGVFTVGLGKGALTEWFGVLAERRQPGAIEAHRASIPSTEPRTFEAYLNLDAARRGFPHAFTESRPSRLLEGWSLSSARDLMFQTRRIKGGGRAANDGPVWPDLLASDVTWTARKDRPWLVYRKALSLESWDQAPEFTGPPPGKVAMLFENDVRSVADGTVETFLNSRKLREMLKDRAVVARWMRAHGSSYRRLMQSFGDHLVLSWSASDPLAFWSSLRLVAPVKPGIRVERVQHDLESLASAFPERFVFDEATQTWTCRLLDQERDPKGLLRLGSVGTESIGRNDVLIWTLAPARSEAANTDP